MHNLWADDQNDPASSRRAATAAKRLTEQALLASLRAWLLHDYAAAYCRALTANPLYRRGYWVDALVVEARARGRNQPVEPPPAAQEVVGTPTPRARKRKGQAVQQAVVPPCLQPVADLNAQLALEPRPLTLHGLALTAGSSRRNDSRAPKPMPAGRPPLAIPREGGLIEASWLEVAPLILQTVDHAPAVFLLNPFGPSLFTADDLALLSQRTPPTELCLLVPHKQVETRLLAARTPAGAAALTKLLRGDRWRTYLPQPGTELSPLAVGGLLDLLMGSLQRQFLSVQRIALPLLARPAFVTTAPYTLIFATRRLDSLLCMNDAVCLDQRRLEQQSHQGVLGEEWFAAQQQERLTEGRQQLYARTLHLGRSQRSRRWLDLRQQLLTSHFGQFTRSEYDQTILQLLQNGAVRCEWRSVPRPGQVRESAVLSTEPEAAAQRVPGNDDTLFWVQ